MGVRTGLLFLIFTLTAQIARIDSSENVSVPARHNFDEVLRAYRKIGRSFGLLTMQGIAEAQRQVHATLKSDPHVPLPNISQPCKEKLFWILGQLNPTDPLSPEWLVKLLDAQAKPPSSILEGNIAWLGGFHECMNLTVYKNESNPTPGTLLLEGQYCLVTIGLEEDKNQSMVPLLGIPKALRAGLCGPIECTASDVEKMVLYAIALLQDFLKEKSPHLLPESLSVTEVKCPAKTIPMQKDAGAIVVIVVLAAIVTIVLVGSAYDVLTNGILTEVDSLSIGVTTVTTSYTSLLPPETVSAVEQETEVKESRTLLGRLCMAVSVFPHCRKFFGAAYGNSDIRWVHGVRVLSMIWIILGQTYALGLPLYDNLVILPEALKGLFGQMVVQATFAVDTFLFLSGFLVTYRFFGILAENGGFDCMTLLRFYLSRYLRLFPTYMLIVGIYATLTKYISSGPLWPQDEVPLGNCSHLAWANAFYVNNFVKPEEMCAPWTWYIAIDFQLFILAPLIILCLYAFWKLGLAICLVFVWAVAITSGVISKLRELPPSLIGFGTADISTFDQNLILRYFNEYLIATYCRASPYFFGIAAAYYLRRPSEVVRLSLLARVIGWIIALIGLGIVVFGLTPGFNGYPLSVDASAAFNSLSHIVWSCSLAWVAYNCALGFGGLVQHFLEWKLWLPFSMISYSVYLFGPVMICIYYLSREEPIRFSHYNAITLFWGNLVFSVLAGLAVYLFIEAPIRSLSKLCLERKRVTTAIVALQS
ncbi:nose resistant to fluoxetine protein 6-like [Paramacrobiotus metropolitanus]|uniref:nose resistant to fluoxetine protein 6-like n=1 Tax=Paramacrobiotus metropolitanus TaxID=2943436 RepID=UPI0024460013|nr:nose resistant to fluoxetine protein 6-like [Paramacrobiotus metropolitanus]